MALGASFDDVQMRVLTASVCTDLLLPQYTYQPFFSLLSHGLTVEPLARLCASLALLLQLVSQPAWSRAHEAHAVLVVNRSTEPHLPPLEIEVSSSSIAG